MSALNEHLDATVAAQVGAPYGADHVPGAVALVAIGDEIAVAAAGDLDASPGRPVVRDSLFRIASTTKPITGAAAMALVGEGLLSIDEPVDRLLPELADRQVLREMGGALDDTVPAERAITVRDVLTFTLGFGMCTELFMAPEPWPIMVADRQLSLETITPPDGSLVKPDVDTWIARLGSLPLMTQPGQRWLYQTGASVAGVLLARAAGQPFEDVLRTRLFEPLGMSDTAFFTTETDRLATAYRSADDGVGLEPWDHPGGLFSRPPAFPDGSGGLVSTIDDLHAFGAMMLRGGVAADGTRVVPEDGVAAMCTAQLTPEQIAYGGLGPGFFDGVNWGYCQAVQDDGSYGWAGGFGATFLVDPARALVAIVLTQRNFESAGPHPIHDAVQSLARTRAVG